MNQWQKVIIHGNIWGSKRFVAIIGSTQCSFFITSPFSQVLKSSLAIHKHHYTYVHLAFH